MPIRTHGTCNSNCENKGETKPENVTIGRHWDGQLVEPLVVRTTNINGHLIGNMKFVGIHWEAIVTEIDAEDRCFQVQMRTGCKISAEQFPELRMASKLNHYQKNSIPILSKRCFQRSVVYLQRRGIQTLSLLAIFLHAEFADLIDDQFRGPGDGAPFYDFTERGIATYILYHLPLPEYPSRDVAANFSRAVPISSCAA